MTDCEFVESGEFCECQKCGRKVLRVQYDCEHHHANCKAGSPPREPTTCVHFLGATNQQTEAIKCGGCKTAVPMTALADCEKHGPVTFVHRAKDESIAWCLNCPDYQSSE